MARMTYDRLSREGEGFLRDETSRQRAHTAMILIFEGGPLMLDNGGVHFERLRKVIESAIAEVPRLRSKVRRVPGDGHPVWVDDAEFNLDYHLRQSSLPRPGGLEQLEKIAARIAASRLDRSRPLWDCWIIEGLEEGRFALVFKMHKALALESRTDLLNVLLSAKSKKRSVSVRPYRPRPAPSPIELFGQEVLRSWSPSRKAIARSIDWVRNPAREGRRVRNQARDLLKALGYVLRTASESPFDARLGPHRTFAFCEVPLATLQSVHRTLGGSMHDVILALVSGGLRRFLEGRLVNPVTVDLRAVTPVLDRSGESAKPWVIEMPVWEPEAAERLRLIREQTLALRESESVSSGDEMTGGAEWTASRLVGIGARALETLELGQVAVLQAPGPQKPLYLDGAKLAACFGILPLRGESGLGMTALSYHGKVYLAFNADTEIVPDLDDLREAIAEELESLERAGKKSGRSLRALSA